MIHRRATSLAALLACAVTLALSGCSSSGGGGANVDVATVPLQPGDLPSSWTAKAHDTSDDADSDATGKQLKSCIGAKDTTGDRTKHVYSKDYSQGDSSITSDAELYKSSSDVDSDVKLFASPKAQPCLEKLFQQKVATTLPAGAKLGTPKLTVTPGNNGGPSNVVATMSIVVPVTVQGQTITIYDTSYSIRGDKIEASIDFTGIGKPIDQATIGKAVAAVAKRAQG